jgi:ammonium transporter, Amt family
VNIEYHDAFKEWLTNHSTNEFRPYNQTYIVTGCLIVAIGWLFLTGGSCHSLFDDRANIPPKVIMNTLISGCTSCVLSVYVKPQVLGTYSFVTRYDCVASCCGFLAGLVGVSGCANYLEPYGALCIGIVSSLVYIGSCKLLEALHIDDPIEACPVNMFCGIWGTIATAFFDNKDGLFYNGPEMWKFFGVQLLGTLAIIAWTALISGAYFLLMRDVFGVFRIDKSIEVIGLDIAEMGGMSNDLFDKILKDNFSRKNSAFMSSHSYRSQIDTLAKNLNASDISNNTNGNQLKSQRTGVSDAAKNL